MKMTFGKAMDSKEELKIVMMSLAVICGSCLLISLISNLTLCYRLGKDTEDDFIWQMLPEIITLKAMTICSVLIFLLLQQVHKRQVFTKLNSNLIMFIGLSIECNGLLQFVLNKFIPGINDNSTYMIYILLGACFLFIACLFKLGVRMQEEQELTV